MFSWANTLKDQHPVLVQHSPESKIAANKPDDTTQSKSNTGGEPVLERRDGSRWIRCPICDSKTRTKVYADTVMFNFPLFCPKCKKEIRIDVMQMKMAIRKEL